ncbi:hypothetical protein, partial [Pseudomonas aeruginosa]|uniref:hypothetical protein n=1 Tax=Pseudomonas aeruginosa TaxID=287 RepID=UPI0024BE4DC8
WVCVGEGVKGMGGMNELMVAERGVGGEGGWGREEDGGVELVVVLGGGMGVEGGVGRGEEGVEVGEVLVLEGEE